MYITMVEFDSGDLAERHSTKYQQICLQENTVGIHQILLQKYLLRFC